MTVLRTNVSSALVHTHLINHRIINQCFRPRPARLHRKISADIFHFFEKHLVVLENQTKNDDSMKRIFALLGVSIIVWTCSCSRTPEGVQPFDMQKISRSLKDKRSGMAKSEIFGRQVLQLAPSDGNDGIVIWTKGDRPDWTDARYLTAEVYDKAEHSGVIHLEFYKTDTVSEKVVVQGGQRAGTATESPWISCMIGVLPQLKTRIVFPLSHLDAQQIFLNRFPRQLKATVTGNRLAPADISKVILRFGPYDDTSYQTSYEIASISLTDELPAAYEPGNPMIDPLGQRTDKAWPGKLKHEEDMIRQHQHAADRVKGAAYPASWSKYGGWKAKRFAATGFFRTQYDGSRWWLVDPEGYAFLSAGIDCISASASGPVIGIEDLFEWLPDSDPAFREAVSERHDLPAVDFYVANLIRIFGKDWKARWSAFTVDLLKSLRFNTVGNWSDLSFAQHSGIPYVLPLRDFPSTATVVYRDFPDVFSDEYRRNAEIFAQQLNDYKDDPYLIGYFLRNEPQWAFGYHNLAYEMFATPGASETKNTFIDWLKTRYGGNIHVLNETWGLNLKDFEALKAETFKNYPSETAKTDFNDFSSVMVRKYVDVPCDEVAKVDKHHLNLGMRYAWISSDLLYKAGERFDVFSINGYGMFPPPTAEIAKKSGKPVMIGEFHHGAVDRALPATGIIGVLSQEDRAAAYRNYMEEGFSRPELVGMHYFQWVDQPYTGRFDGENYNIGVVNTADIPYEELMKGMKQTNGRIYEVATGKAQPYRKDIPPTPAIHY